MIDAALTQAGMVGLTGISGSLVLAAALRNGTDPNLLCIRQTKGQLIAMNLDFHRIAHRRQLHNGNLCAGDNAHIQKMLAKRTLAANGQNLCALTDSYFFQRHIVYSPWGSIVSCVVVL